MKRVDILRRMLWAYEEEMDKQMLDPLARDILWNLPYSITSFVIDIRDMLEDEITKECSRHA
jgi:hypothetical protein